MWSCHWTPGSDPAAQLRAGAALPMHLLRPIPCSNSDFCPPPLPLSLAPASDLPSTLQPGWTVPKLPLVSSARIKFRVLAGLSFPAVPGTTVGVGDTAGQKADSPCPPGVGVLRGVGQRQVRMQVKGDTVQLPGPRPGSEEAAGTKTLPR